MESLWSAPLPNLYTDKDLRGHINSVSAQRPWMSFDSYTCLLVEDDESWRETFAELLRQRGFTVVATDTASSATRLAANRPHVVLLDLSLPDAPGLQVLERLRSTFPNIPVIVISGDARIASKVEAFERGASDYIVKAASTDEASARIKAIARAAAQRSTDREASANVDFRLDANDCTVFLRGARVQLSRKEFALLSLFVAQPGKVLHQDFLIDTLWGPQTDPQLLRVFVAALRRKIETQPESPRHILTVRGLGYRFQF